MNHKSNLFLFMSLILSIGLAGCSSRDTEAVKRLESFMQQQKQQAKLYRNIDNTMVDMVNATELIEELASSKYKGRKTGTAENEKAVGYIVDYFKKIGLDNPPKLTDYQQPFRQSVTRLKTAPKLELLNADGSVSKSFDYPEDFVLRILSDQAEDIQLTSNMKLLNRAADINADGFENMDVLLLPLAAQGRKTPQDLMKAAYPTQAGALILEADVKGEDSRYSNLIVTALNSKAWGEEYKPVLMVDKLTFAELSLAAHENKKISFQCSYEIEADYIASNVIGFIPGSDKVLKDHYVIIGAHLDHVGDNMDGTYNPGAFDNASGVGAMMEIARVIAEAPVKPKKSIVFIAFNGEEYFLNGSEHYVHNPLFPLENAVMINLDMVGSAYPVPLSVANSNEFVTDLKYEFLELAKLRELEAVASDITASDHTSFAQAEVPAVLLSNMDDEHGYHSPDDTMEDIDSSRLEEIIKLVLYYIDRKAY